MRFFGGSSQPERPAELPFATAGAYETNAPLTDFSWNISESGLTTQYKSFYFNFDDGSAGFLQVAYGNLGILVKVAPLSYSYYAPDEDAIVASHTLRASQMKVSADRYSIHVAQHFIVMDDDHKGWTAQINDDQLKYDLHFRAESEAYVVHDFGRKVRQQHIRQRFVPKVSVTGTVNARGVERRVQGYATYTEASYLHLKFTDFCNEFTNFQLRSADSSEVLCLMQYIPRAGTSSGPLIGQGAYTKDGKVVSMCFECDSVATGKALNGESGYELPTDLTLTWAGTTSEGKRFKASCTLATPEPSSTTDVLSMFPKFFKDIVAIFAGSPYVFCWRARETVARIEIDGQVSELRGISSTELTKVHRPPQ